MDIRRELITNFYVKCERVQLSKFKSYDCLEQSHKPIELFIGMDDKFTFTCTRHKKKLINQFVFIFKFEEYFWWD